MNSTFDSLLCALGWALVHSLWQGALAALLLLLLLPRLQTARQRYWAAYATLFAVLLAVIVTIFWKIEFYRNVSQSVPLASVATTEGTLIVVENQLFTYSLPESFSQWLEANHMLIVAGWLVGFLFFLFRLGGGLWQVQRLKTRDIISLAPTWQEKLTGLSRRIGVLRTVQLFESIRVHAPLTVGWLKPVILLPLGFVNQLSPAEVEAVLAHELAHIARRDWFFNVLQAFVESLFYYHPAVWWISQVIRRERENACDDAALAATGNPIAFARALVQVQEMATPLPALALAMSGKRRRPLLERARRILNQAPQQQHQVMEKITATIILLALLALVGLRANSVPEFKTAFAQIADLPESLFNGNKSEMLSDSLPNPKNSRKITREDDNGRIEVEFKNGELKRLNIDGKEIPESEFAQHESLVEELQEEVPPVPPIPPTPPAPRNFWGAPGSGSRDMPSPPGSPDAPDAPGMFWFRSPDFPAIAPKPPFPPMHPMGSGMSIVTDKDSEGNTIIKLDNHGSETEVVVKNGEVWIDGKKMEKGESLDIPGFNFGQDGHQFFFNDAQGSGYNFGEGDFTWSDDMAPHGFSSEQIEQLNREMEQAREQHGRAMEDYERSFERDRKQAQKERKDSDKDWKKQQKEWEKQQKTWKKEQQNWEMEQQRWQDGQQKWQAEHRAVEQKNKAAQDMLKKELLRDGLITDTENFSLQLNAKELKVNKKKQSEALRLKYETLIKGSTGMKLDGEDWNYNFNLSN